jgi:calcium permeable stress-gated cation channel
MPELYSQRLAACNKLESAETSLLNTAAKLRTKKLKKELKAAKKSGKITTRDIPMDGHSIDGRPLTAVSTVNTDFDPERDPSFADRFVPVNKRPTHRLPVGFLPFSLPLIGKKVDSIDWAKQEIGRTAAALTRSQRVLASEVTDMTRSSLYSNMPLKDLAAELDKQSYPPLNSAFVLFNKQIAAHMAAQALAHHEPYQMASKYIDVTPEDVIWDNLSMNPYEAKLRIAISYLATAGLVR